MQTFPITPITVRVAEVDVEATDAKKNPVILDAVEMAFLPRYVSPDATTVWTHAVYRDDVATITVVGPEAVTDSATYLRVPTGGGVLWGRAVDNPEVDAFAIAFFSVV